MTRIVIYPNNTACVDGKMLTAGESESLMREHSISVQRSCKKDNDDPKRLLRGDVLLIVYPQPGVRNNEVRMKMLASYRVQDRKRRVQEQHRALYEEYCRYKGGSLTEVEILMRLSRSWCYSAEYIRKIIMNQMRGQQ